MMVLLRIFFTMFDSRATHKKNAAEEVKAETTQNTSHQSGEQSVGNVVPMGGKLATAARSSAYNVQTLNDMDLQNGGVATNVAMKGVPTMNESVTRSETLNVDPATKP